jgi:hypothetical protein
MLDADGVGGIGGMYQDGVWCCSKVRSVKRGCLASCSSEPEVVRLAVDVCRQPACLAAVSPSCILGVSGMLEQLAGGEDKCR